MKKAEDVFKQGLRGLHAGVMPTGGEHGEASSDADEMWEYLDDGSVRLRPAYKAKKNAERALKALAQSGIGEKYWDVSVDNLRRTDGLAQVLRGLRRFDELQAAGQNLILVGGLGTGKTQAAVLVMKHALSLGLTARLENLGLVAVDVRDGYGSHAGEKMTERMAIERMATPDLLVLDDLGAGETASAMVEKRLLYLTLEQRCNHKRMTIVTTNLQAKAMVKTYGKRILERLQPSTTIEFEGGSFRLTPTQGVTW
jgi:DNA replication protein DnaC